MYHLSNPRGVVDATQEELSILAQVGPEAIRRAVRAFEAAGLMSTTRTKRNHGKLHKNSYQFLVASPVPAAVDPLRREGIWTSLTPPARGVDIDGLPLQPEGLNGGQPDGVPLQPVGSTAINESTGSISQVTNKLGNSALGTSYLKGRAAGAPIEPEGDMNRWNTDEDYAVGTIGLLPDEVQSNGAPKPKADRRKASTRGQRPESEWTANDVAAEFAYKLSRHFPKSPGLVNVAAVRGALMKYRSDFGTTPEVEMELMRMFFEDEYNIKLAGEAPSRAHGRYLAMFKTKLPQAHERLGFEFESRVVVDEEDVTEYLYTADGRRFENNFAGRAAMRGHELRLQNA